MNVKQDKRGCCCPQILNHLPPIFLLSLISGYVLIYLYASSILCILVSVNRCRNKYIVMHVLNLIWIEEKFFTHSSFIKNWFEFSLMGAECHMIMLWILQPDVSATIILILEVVHCCLHAELSHSQASPKTFTNTLTHTISPGSLDPAFQWANESMPGSRYLHQGIPVQVSRLEIPDPLAELLISHMCLLTAIKSAHSGHPW